MAITTKRIALSGSGTGSTTVPPCWFVGGTGYALAENDGNSLGTAFHTKNAEQFVAGEIDVQGGAPSGEAILYFDFS